MGHQNDIETIREGFVNYYLIHGLGFLVLAFVSFYFSNIIPFIFIAISIALFCTVSGFEIDKTQQKYRTYKIILGIKFGEWKSISTGDKFYLMISTESFVYLTLLSMRFVSPGNFYNGNKSKSLTYDIVVTADSGTKKMVNQFLKYKQGKHSLSILNQLGFETTDKIAEKIMENRARRS